MQARYYDPVIGRFYSNDPVDATAFLSQGNIHGFNRYTYANNNPYRYIDPNGESPLEPLLRDLAMQTYIEVKKAEIIGKDVLANKRGHNDLGDAIRHSTWHYRMMEETKLPSFAVRGIGIAHEIKGYLKNDQPMEEFWMDLNNNAEGINASMEGRQVNQGNLITTANEGDNNYEQYSGGKVTGVVRVSGRIESQKLKELDEK